MCITVEDISHSVQHSSASLQSQSSRVPLPHSHLLCWQEQNGEARPGALHRLEPPGEHKLAGTIQHFLPTKKIDCILASSLNALLSEEAEIMHAVTLKESRFLCEHAYYFNSP